MSQRRRGDARKYHREIEPVLRNNYYQTLAQVKYIFENQDRLLEAFLRSSPPVLTDVDIAKIYKNLVGGDFNRLPTHERDKMKHQISQSQDDLYMTAVREFQANPGNTSGVSMFSKQKFIDFAIRNMGALVPDEIERRVMEEYKKEQDWHRRPDGAPLLLFPYEKPFGYDHPILRDPHNEMRDDDDRPHYFPDHPFLPPFYNSPEAYMKRHVPIPRVRMQPDEEDSDDNEAAGGVKRKKQFGLTHDERMYIHEEMTKQIEPQTDSGMRAHSHGHPQAGVVSDSGMRAHSMSMPRSLPLGDDIVLSPAPPNDLLNWTPPPGYKTPDWIKEFESPSRRWPSK